MPSIQLLSPSEARKIAAGEVVERPAHIVKELLENAIDAGATSITLHAERAGKERLSITDNGHGMSPTDARLCFLPHATSKIRSVDELDAIASYGFRGEALASIAAVSKVTLTTREPTAQLGTKITYTEDQLLTEEQVAAPVGSLLVIDDLFYNTPARKKFMKQDETEWNAIQQVVYAFCLSHRQIHFKLYHNGKLQLNAPGVASARDRAAQLWGPEVAAALLPISEQRVADQLGLQVSGYLSNHQFWRYGKTHIHFFVNGRWVKNPELGKALLRGYLGVLPPDRFPAAVVFLNLSQAEIDVNIHPKKEEVRFSKPGTVATALTNAVKATLESNISTRLAPTQHASSSDFMPTMRPLSTQPPVIWPLHEHAITLPDVFDLKPAAAVPAAAAVDTEEQAVQHHLTRVAPPPYRIMGQLMQTYILCAKADELIMVDQHAAHERILYERYASYFDEAHGSLLLFPEVVRLPPALMQGLLGWQAYFAKQGIAFDAISEGDIAIRSAPPQLRGPSLTTLLTEAADFIAEHGSLDRAAFTSKFNEHVHSHMACKAAIKAGDALSMEAMQQLIDDLMTVNNRFICVHGRPTIWSLSKQDIEKKFRRL